MIRVLGIDVADDLLARWREWFAPAVQPFRLDGLRPEIAAELPVREGEVSDEVRDTCHLYGGRWTWLEEPEFRMLSTAARRSLAVQRREHRGVWWPETVTDQAVIAYVEEGVRPSRHAEVRPEIWAAAEDLVPGAESLAGTFPSRSGPNCFGTVMAAAGVAGAEHEWMFQEPFEKWLAEHAVPIRGTSHDDEPGIVLVWRDAAGLAAHAAVTIGGGYAISKPSQAWCSPRVAWTVRETVAAGRRRGGHLARHQLVTRPARAVPRIVSPPIPSARAAEPAGPAGAGDGAG